MRAFNLDILGAKAHTFDYFRQFSLFHKIILEIVSEYKELI